MVLKENPDLEAFFEAIRQCGGEVYFHSAEDDVLNLKSRLCLYLFAAAYRTDRTFLRGEIVFDNPEDGVRLGDFLREEPGEEGRETT